MINMCNPAKLTPAAVNKNAEKLALIEIKLYVNQKLYQKGALTEEMYTKAKELILRDEQADKYSA